MTLSDQYSVRRGDSGGKFVKRCMTADSHLDAAATMLDCTAVDLTRTTGWMGHDGAFTKVTDDAGPEDVVYVRRLSAEEAREARRIMKEKGL